MFIQHRETWHHTRFQRKPLQQAFTEGVDGLDFEATGCFQCLGEKTARGGIVEARLTGHFMNRLGQFIITHRDPTGKPIKQAARHFTGRSLGKGEAENARGLGAGE